MSRSRAPLRVAIVGAGPAGFYAARELLSTPSLHVEITMLDRLPTLWGLVRSGVAPDHLSTKLVTHMFHRTLGDPRFRLHLNVEVGRHVSHEDLLAHHDAVLYAIGGSDDRKLRIPGEERPNVFGAAAFVGWYNGHPDFADTNVDVSGRRAVVIGNGNVALDVARVLLLDRDELARTDIAPHALATLARNNIREVVVLGRRGPEHAAFTAPELLGLGALADVDVAIEPASVRASVASGFLAPEDHDPYGSHVKLHLLRRLATEAREATSRRVVLRFLGTPLEIVDVDGRLGVRLEQRGTVPSDPTAHGQPPAGHAELLPTDLVVRAIGFRSSAVPGLPFDLATGTIPNDDGRIIDPESGTPLAGSFVAGWAKRGPSGVIGTNKQCAKSSVHALLSDFDAGLLPRRQSQRPTFDDLVRTRQPDAVNLAQWRNLEAHELAAGSASGRPREKLVRIAEMIDVALGVRSTSEL